MLYKIAILISLIYIIGGIIIDPLKTEWISTGEHNPSDRLYDLVNIYGPPTTIDRNSGGLAIWTKDTLNRLGFCWRRIVLKDEQIPHSNPTPHSDFLYTTVDYTIPDNKIQEIMGLSDSIMYDQLKKQIIVRCHFEGANKATLVLAMRIADNQTTLKQIQENGLYRKFITRTIENRDFEKMLDDEICNKLKWNI